MRNRPTQLELTLHSFTHFRRSLFNRLFNKGQVISTDRGRGIFQPALDRAIAKLEEGQWVHLFPEGYVNLSRTMVLRRFKWGMSRLLLESEQRPKVVPIWIEGEHERSRKY